MTDDRVCRLADVVGALEAAYPPALAESWDSVGLVCGDPADAVTHVLVCVDVTDAVVDAAVGAGVDLIVAHHPLLLRGVDSVAADTPKGRIVHRLIRAGIALFTAHTNADRARPGVSDALADLLGVRDTVPLAPAPSDPLDKWVVMVPEGNAEQVSEAMFAVGAGSLGDYRDCAWSVVGTGQFEAQDAADPAIGVIGERTRVDEARIEIVADRGLRAAVLAALRTAHPYEEPAYDILELAETASDVGLGRVGLLPRPVPMREFLGHAAEVLRSPWGIRATGEAETPIATVAVCGGAGDGLLGAAAASGADLYLTGDLRHHPADESLRAGGPALVDAGHWATEFPWCATVAAVLTDACALTASVHDTPTDPFCLHTGT